MNRKINPIKRRRGGTNPFSFSVNPNYMLNPKYVIGVDTYDKNALAYCLTRLNADDTTEVIMAKSMVDEKEFNQEVENLAKYFNADLIKEQ